MEKPMRVSFGIFGRVTGLSFIGHSILIVGLLRIAFDYADWGWLAFIFNTDLVIGDIAIVLIGVVASMTAREFRKLEERLDRLDERVPGSGMAQDAAPRPPT